MSVGLVKPGLSYPEPNQTDEIIVMGRYRRDFIMMQKRWIYVCVVYQCYGLIMISTIKYNRQLQSWLYHSMFLQAQTNSDIKDL